MIKKISIMIGVFVIAFFAAATLTFAQTATSTNSPTPTTSVTPTVTVPSGAPATGRAK